jgi:sugar lactone lactonase YvrE
LEDPNNNNHLGRKGIFTKTIMKLPLSIFATVVIFPLAGLSDTIYVANRGGHNVIQFTDAGVGSIYASTGLKRPEGLAFDDQGNLFVADDTLNSVFRFTPCGDGSLFSDSSLLVSYPGAEAIDTAGNLYVANYTKGTIVRFTPGGVGSIFATNAIESTGLVFDAAGNLYSANAGNNTITRYIPGGAASVYASTNLSYPSGPAFDRAGNLYVANQVSYTIVKVAPDGSVSTFATKSNGINWPTSVGFDSAGNLYVVNYGNSTILKFAPGSSTGSVFASGLNGPTFLVVRSSPPTSLSGVGLLGTPASGLPWFVYHSFDGAQGLKINGSANLLSGCAGALQLTPALAAQSGSAFSSAPIPLAANGGFSTFFTFKLSSPGGGQGSGGTAFVIQNVGNGALGGVGSSLARSLVVEFNPDGNAVSVNASGASTPSSTRVFDSLSNGNLWYAWIDYSGVAKSLEVRLSAIPIRPETNILAMAVDLPTVLGGTSAYVGFSAATGSGWHEQSVLSWKFTSTPTLRVTGQLALTNAPPGFTLSNGVLVRKVLYHVNSVWYTNNYLYPLTFTGQSSNLVTFTSPAESGLIAEPGSGDREFTAIVATYSQSSQLTATLPKSASPRLGSTSGLIGDINGIMVDILSPLSPLPLSGSPLGGDLVPDINTILSSLSSALLSQGSSALPSLSGSTFKSMFPGYDETEVQGELQNIIDQVQTGFPPTAPDLPQMIDTGAELIAGLLPISIPEEAQPLLDLMEQLNNTLNTSVQNDSSSAVPDYAVEAVICSAANRIGLMALSKQILLSPQPYFALSSPHFVDQTNLVFSLSTVSNQPYTVWGSSDLAKAGWAKVMSFAGDGYKQQVRVSVPKSSKGFYRVSAP